MPPTPADAQSSAADAQALRSTWLGLKDTHEFFGMLRQFKVSRLAAMEAAGPDLAQRVDGVTVETVLNAVAASGLPIMCFVANRGIVQIHTGPVHKLVRTGPWFNVLDPKFNLHLNTEAIASSWIVNKPTTDGWVTSLEVYSATGDMIVQFFGERKPGKPELPAWRELMLGLCAEPLARHDGLDEPPRGAGRRARAHRGGRAGGAGEAHRVARRRRDRDRVRPRRGRPRGRCRRLEHLPRGRHTSCRRWATTAVSRSKGWPA